MADLNELHQKIQVWLEQIFGGESIHQFELNGKTLAILNDLMKINQVKDRDAQLIVEDHSQKVEEYNSDGKKLGQIVEGIKLTPVSLSQSGITSLQTLANLAALMHIKNTTYSSYYLALQNLHTEETRLEDSREQERKLITVLFDKTRSSLIKYNSLNKALETLQEQRGIQKPKIEGHLEQAGFLKTKALEYRKMVQNYQGRLVKLDVTPDIYQKTLVKKSEDLQNLQEKIAPLKDKLQCYRDLPPDILQAKVKIEELRRQVTELEEELSSKINMMHL